MAFEMISIQNILNLLQKYENIRSKKRKINLPDKPTPTTIRIEKHYKDSGQKLGMCPYELKQIIVNGLMNTDNPGIADSLKEFVLSSKLAVSDGLVEIRAKVKKNEEANRKKEENGKKNVKRY